MLAVRRPDRTATGCEPGQGATRQIVKPRSTITLDADGQPLGVRGKPRAEVRTWGRRKRSCRSLAIYPEKCALADARPPGNIGERTIARYAELGRPRNWLDSDVFEN